MSTGASSSPCSGVRRRRGRSRCARKSRADATDRRVEGDAEHDPDVKARLAAFQQGLDRLGWSLDHNVRIEYRFAANNADQYCRSPKSLIRLQPDVLPATGHRWPRHCGRESRTIPIVFVSVSDPIGSGLVASLAQPGGNLTGLLLYEEGITGKWLAMLKEIAPGLSRTALIANPKRTRNTIISCDRPSCSAVTGDRVEHPLSV